MGKTKLLCVSADVQKYPCYAEVREDRRQFRNEQKQKIVVLPELVEVVRIGKKRVGLRHQKQQIPERRGVVKIRKREPLDEAKVRNRQPPAFPERYVRLKPGIRHKKKPDEQRREEPVYHFAHPTEFTISANVAAFSEPEAKWMTYWGYPGTSKNTSRFGVWPALLTYTAL